MSTSTHFELGSVVSLWRHAVKSMMGEELNASEVTERGLLGDRAYGVVDGADGRVASALNKILSEALNRQVTLNVVELQDPGPAHAEEYWPDMEGLEHRDTVTDFTLPEGTFFDCATVHLVTTATVDRLRELYPNGRFEVRRFRPNIVVEPASGAKGFVENGWIGRTIRIGNDVRLSVTGPCARCVMTTLPQGDLPQDPGILRTAAQHNQANVGVYAAVARGGAIRRGDRVRLE